MEPTLDQLIAALWRAWTAETSYDSAEWSADNPARGQCVVSALIVQDYFGGELVRFAVSGNGISEMHYANLLDGDVLFDVTRSQYQDVEVIFTPKPVDLKGHATIRHKRLTDPETRRRYELLRSRIDEFLTRP